MLSAYLTKRLATKVARRFRAAGYRASRATCTGYVCNVVEHHAGADIDAQVALAAIVMEVL